jgi:mannose-1-phosphate guanylyltransferase / phosphomannomutase
MKAVIMAGGEGTRLRPLTSNLPKPMMPLANKPMMEHVVDLLRRHGFEEIVVTLAFMPDAIRTYFGDGSEFGVHIQYATEEVPLGTAGSVRNAADALDERFLVISGDVLTDIDLDKVVAFHEEKGALATIGLVPVENPLEFGIVITREDGSIERFLEKPSWGQVFSDTINTGIFVLEPAIFDHIPGDRAVDFSSEVFPSLLRQGLPLFGAVADGYWEDVGTPEAYVSVHKDILDQKVEVAVPGFEVSGGVWIGEGGEVHPDAMIDGPAVVGDNARVGAGVRLGEYAVLGANVKVRDGAEVRRSIVQDNAYLGEGVRLAGTVVGRACDIRRGARLEDGSVVGDECFIGEDAVIGTGVKVYPFKTVEAAAVVNTSIVWESRGARELFGARGVMGLANVDITPEFAARLAMAYGTTLKKDATVVTSRDSSRSARMLKRAMMAGLNSAGINVSDLEVASVPVTRFQAARPDNGGGLTVRLAPDDPQQVEIRFLDDKGHDLDDDGRRKVARSFNRQDFRRALPS